MKEFENNTMQNDTVQQYERPNEVRKIEVTPGNYAEFRIFKWGPSKVFERMPEIGSVLAVPYMMYETAKENAEDDLEQRIAMALIQLFSGLEQKNLAEFMKKILDEVYTEDGKYNVADKFDEIFILHPELVLDLATLVLEINYGPFFKRGFGKLLTQFKGIGNLVNN